MCRIGLGTHCTPAAHAAVTALKLLSQYNFERLFQTSVSTMVFTTVAEATLAKFDLSKSLPAQCQLIITINCTAVASEWLEMSMLWLIQNAVGP